MATIQRHGRVTDTSNVIRDEQGQPILDENGNPILDDSR